MLKMPEARQVHVRQRLKKELDQVNAKLADSGYEPLKLAELIESVRGDKELADGSESPADADVAAKPDAKRSSVAVQEIEAAVKSAYLRMLCRQPDQEELSVAVAFVQESDESVSGFRSVVWALLNTKEFVLTH